ncbi:hypothetical protein K466DRAFT_543348 [Polyporus arcularius HHB13444]|uniref:F-box domain-containing protein n=1 Tax=Polyporus arcularius HHB13444 TaxID=1314778 RepID=A0A5C3PLB0_9APHY|nr:hypothetical protein K466DRAFT_543348 [Polyporus arcularius HHB13444]
MHEALRIPEILSHICTFAEKCSLARLARCCSRFQEPANMVLWEHPPNILPLIRCFPGDVWSVAESPEGSSELSFMRPPGPQDWHRFIDHSRYVRYLSTNMRGKPMSLHREVLLLMAALRPAVELFPKLRTLSWCGAGGVLDCEHLPVVLSLTGLSLQFVSIQCWPLHLDQKMILQTSLALLESRSPRVQRISVRFKLRTHHRPTAPSPMQTLPSGFTNLGEFVHRGSALGEHSFKALAGLQSLRALDVQLPCGLSWSVAGMSSQPFTNLKKLVLATTLPSYAAFSFLLALPSVEDLSLIITGYSEEREPGLLAASVRRQSLPSTLSRIHITHEIADWQEAPALSSHHLRPFLEFRDIVEFSYRPPFKLSLDNWFFTDMAKAWPRLRDLCVACADRNITAHPSLPTLYILPAFAANCPDLSKLALTLNAEGRVAKCHRVDEEPPSASKSDASKSKLTCMEVIASPIINPGYVARYLAQVFPEIVSFRASEFTDTAQGRTWRLGWEEVGQYLPVFTDWQKDAEPR